MADDVVAEPCLEMPCLELASVHIELDRVGDAAYRRKWYAAHSGAPYATQRAHCLFKHNHPRANTLSANGAADENRGHARRPPILELEHHGVRATDLFLLPVE